MGFNCVGPLGSSGLNGVRIDCSLSEQMIIDPEALSLTVENLDEGITDDPPFFLRFDYSFERREEVLGCVNEREIFAEAELFEVFNDLGTFVLTH